MGHSDILGSRIDGDQFKVNASRPAKVVKDEYCWSLSIKESGELDHSLNREMNYNCDKQRHLSVDNSKLPIVTSQVGRPGISDEVLIDINEHFKIQKVITCSPKTPKLSKIERLKLNFERVNKKKGDFETEKPGNSPGLLRYMQNNEKRLSEKLKVKHAKSSLKKLKKQEKETKSAMLDKNRQKFREIQQMFDKLSKKNASENQNLESQGGPNVKLGTGGSYIGPQNKCPRKPKLEVSTESIECPSGKAEIDTNSAQNSTSMGIENDDN